MRSLYYTVLFSLCFLLCSFNLFSELDHTKIQVGQTPIYVNSDYNGVIHIFCAGVDANFNGIFEVDSGDVSASWWKYFPGYKTPTKVMDLNGFLDTPFRPAIVNDTIYFNLNSKVQSFDLINNSLVNDCVINLKANAVSIDKNNMYLSIRVYDGWALLDNYVLVYNLNSKTITDTLKTNANVQQTLPFSFVQYSYLAVLSEGVMNNNNSTLQLFKIQDNKFQQIDSVNIGDVGNYLKFTGSDKLAIVINNSHKVMLYDFFEHKLSDSILLPTTGWNGPREIVDIPFLCGYSLSGYVISSYNGYIYHYTSLGTNYCDSIQTDGKAEGMYSDFSYLYVTNPFKADYSSNNIVDIFRLTLSANEINQLTTKCTISPNPVINQAKLSFTSDNQITDNLVINILDYNGKTVYSTTILANNTNEIEWNFSANEIGINTGYYIAQIQYNSIKKNIPFLVIK